MADGTKLPPVNPVIIFKLVHVPREEFPDGVIIHTNKEGWMNEKEIFWWIENVWKQRARRKIIKDHFSIGFVYSTQN